MDKDHDYQQCVNNFDRIFNELEKLNSKLIGNGQLGIITKVALHDEYIEQDKIYKAEDRQDKAAMLRNIKGGLIANALTLVMIALTLFKIFN